MRLAAWTTLLSATFLTAPSVFAQAAADPAVPVAAPDVLLEGFRAPPDTARPRIWWHWLSGNVSRHGITKDLEWMKRIGIAGAMMFDGDMGAPKIVPERVTVLSPQWYSNLKFAASEADRLGLEFSMAAAPGWSETGGPWVTPDAGMKKFVWSTTLLQGHKPAGKIAALPGNYGPFQGVLKRDHNGIAQSSPGAMAHDVAVLAFRAPDGEIPLRALAPHITSSATGLNLDALTDGDLEKIVTLPMPRADAPQWIRYDFEMPQTLRALIYVGPVGGRFAEGPQGRIECSDDGVNWRSVRTLVGAAHNPAPQRTFSFPATQAKHFRVIFERGTVSREPFPRADTLNIAELAFVPGARINLFEDRAAFGVLAEEDLSDTPEVAPKATVQSASILDLSNRLKPDGTLDWTPPAGRWIVLRTGWSLTGEVNHPATPEGTGLEVDKLNARHVRAHLDAYMAPVIRELGGLVGDKGLRYLLTDSWEAGQENWTEDMPAEFKKRRGYDLIRMLPALAGYVVDGASRSDSFLWDFRRTLADLIAENHYGTITRFAKDHRLGYYGEATGAAWPTVADGMLSKSWTDIPMGEFWAMPFGGRPAAYQQVASDEFPADIIETRSTAHVYGKTLVAAEALTSSLPQWRSTPWNLKWVADKYMAMGVNRLVLHTAPHQPDDEHKPGLTLGPFGQAFSRHETWGELAKPWIDYLSRSSFMLQQGVPVTDILYFYGEGAPSGVPYDRAGAPADLRQFGFDYVNADALTRLAEVSDGRIRFPGGASYRLLVLPKDNRKMTLAMVRKLRDLVAAGAILVGSKPIASPSLSANDDAVKTIADALWGQTDGRSLTVNAYGKGRVYWREDVESVLRDENIQPDFQASPVNPEMDLRFAHRRTDDSDIYFVTNQSPIAASVSTRFRVSGKRPEHWDPADGRSHDLGYRLNGPVTEVPLTLAAYESAFVVFRKNASQDHFAPPRYSEQELLSLDDGWKLSFPLTDHGADSRDTRVGSWTDSDIPDQRYFSGIGTYRRTLRVNAKWLRAGARMKLDLGNIGDVAEVTINGKYSGTAWKPPYRVDVTDFLHAGTNDIEIRIANSWQNRFVGDQQPGARKQAWTNVADGGGFVQIGARIDASTPLTPSGLLGPVRLIIAEQERPH